MKSIVACGLALMLTLPASVAFADENPTAPTAPAAAPAAPAAPQTAGARLARFASEHPVVTAAGAIVAAKAVGNVTENPRKRIASRVWARLARGSLTGTALTAAVIAASNHAEGVSQMAQHVASSGLVGVGAIATVGFSAMAVRARLAARRARNNISWRAGRAAAAFSSRMLRNTEARANRR